MDKLSLRYRRLLPLILVDQPRRGAERNRVHPNPSGDQRTDSARCRPAPARMGVPRSRRLWTDAVSSIAICFFCRLSEVLGPGAEWNRRILGDRLAEHS